MSNQKSKRKHRKVEINIQPPGPPPAGQCKASGVIEEKNIRFRGKQWLLTYSNLEENWNHENIIDYLLNTKKLNITQWLIGKEKFNINEKSHWHVYIKLATEKDTQDHKWAWINEKSCDYSKVKNFHGIEYAMKDMDFKQSGKIDFFPNSMNYKKRKIDHDEWYVDRFKENRPEIKWPIALPIEGLYMTKPNMNYKKRNFWFRAPPNFGKSKWMSELGLAKIFYIMGAEHPLEGYKDEELIIVIGVKLEWTLIEWLTEEFQDYVNAPGKQRYSQIKSKPKLVRSILYLGNDLPEYGNNQDAFLERFIVIDMYK